MPKAERVKKEDLEETSSIAPDLFIGVDGGGTKTLANLTDAHLNVLGEGKTGVSNPLRVGVETAVDNIVTAIDRACDAADKPRSEIAAAEIGLAGVRRADIRSRMRDRLISRLR